MLNSGRVRQYPLVRTRMGIRQHDLNADGHEKSKAGGLGI